MSVNEEQQPVVRKPTVTTDVVMTTLSEEEIRNLTGFFDVLIQMDLAHMKQLNERKDKADDDSVQSSKPSTS